MSILVTGMVATMSMLSGVATQNSDMILKRNAAFYAAEAGIQQAIWNMNNNPAWISSLPVSGALGNECSYTVSTLGVPNWPTAPVTFQSVGVSADGTVISQASITVTSTGVAPALAIGATLADSGVLTIAGGVEVVGNVTRSGTMTLTNVAGLQASSLESMGQFTSSGNFTVPGNLLFNSSIVSSGTVTVSGNAQAGSTITDSKTGWHVAGTTQQDDDPDLSITPPTVNTAALISDATPQGTMLGGSYSNKTINFNNTSNGIVYVDGNLTLTGVTTIVGSGTLVVQGALTMSGSLGSAGTPAAMGIVTTGNITTSGQLYINGCLCAGGSLTKSGTAGVTGVVVVQSSLTGSGNISIAYAAPPWFIQYPGTGGSGNIQLTNFSGATY